MYLCSYLLLRKLLLTGLLPVTLQRFLKQSVPSYLLENI
nr:MAG TPA: hypothetical protein [Caudoviricetes sp.]